MFSHIASSIAIDWQFFTAIKRHFIFSAIAYGKRWLQLWLRFIYIIIDHRTKRSLLINIINRCAHKSKLNGRCEWCVCVCAFGSNWNMIAIIRKRITSCSRKITARCFFFERVCVYSRICTNCPNKIEQFDLNFFEI